MEKEMEKQEMTLVEFLRGIETNGISEEFIVSNRLKGKKFLIRALNMDEINDIRNVVSRSSSTQLNTATLARELILTAVVEPNFRDANILREFGLASPEQAVQKFLLPGEQDILVQKINEISGYKNERELVLEAKN